LVVVLSAVALLSGVLSAVVRLVASLVARRLLAVEGGRVEVRQVEARRVEVRQVEGLRVEGLVELPLFTRTLRRQPSLAHKRGNGATESTFAVLSLQFNTFCSSLIT